MATLMSNLDAIESAPDADTRKLKVNAAKDHLNAKNIKPRQQYFDPNDLPNKSLPPNPDNTPKLTEGDFIQAGLYNNPTVKLAALGDFTYDKLAGANNPAYLAATTEVVLTPAIQAKAAELDHDPVKIYHWVRNHVEWQPAWGAVQDADLTLSAQRGNALDISSLLIALLRAAGIPARSRPPSSRTGWAASATPSPPGTLPPPAASRSPTCPAAA
jgi:transglutaminase-like putative cysteine protease